MSEYPNGGTPACLESDTLCWAQQSCPDAHVETDSDGTQSVYGCTPAQHTTQASDLPLTGGDVTGLAGVGLSLAIIGTVLVRRARRKGART